MPVFGSCYYCFWLLSELSSARENAIGTFRIDAGRLTTHIINAPACRHVVATGVQAVARPYNPAPLWLSLLLVTTHARVIN